FVMRMFDASAGRFNAGTLAVVPPATVPAPDPPKGICPDDSHHIGIDVLNTCDFLDTDTFVTLAMAASPRYRGMIDWRRPVSYARTTFAQSLSAGGVAYSGFSLVTS